MQIFFLWLVALAILGCGGNSSGSGSSSSEHTMWMLRNQSTGAGVELVRFKVDDSGSISSQPSNAMAITGLVNSETPVGIDFRASDKQLFLLSSETSCVASGCAGHIYKLSSATGVAAVVKTPALISATDAWRKMKIDPQTNQIRLITSDGSQNLVIDADSGAIVAMDTALSFVSGDIEMGATPGVTTYSFYNGTLFGVNVNSALPQNNNLVTIGGANGSPAISTGQIFTKVGITTPFPGTIFDFTVLRTNGLAMILLSSNGKIESRLFRIDLSTGVITDEGLLGDNTAPVNAITFEQ